MATSASETCELSSSNMLFCKNVYEVLRKEPGNIFYSPTSLEFALTMLYAGTEGTTAEEIKRGLNLLEPKDRACEAAMCSMSALKKSPNVTLNVANALFVQERFKLKKAYTDVVKKYFAAQVSNVDFVTEDALKTINGYVASETKNKITELFKSGDFDEMTRLVLVNAIYFKGDWANKFNPDETFKGDFHVSKKEKIRVDFMKQNAKLRVGYPSHVNAAVVVLPYKGDSLHMVLIVPNEIEGLKEIESKLHEMDLSKMVNETFTEEVILTMPKFKLSQSMDLKRVLTCVGMAKMFTSQAELKGIADDDLYVSSVVQKTYIEVNEEGAEAAAATGIAMSRRMMPLPPREITVQSPFLFFITDSKRIPFMGRLARP